MRTPNESREPQVPVEHTLLRAIVYERSAVPEQGPQSSAVRNIVSRLIRRGWSASQILVIDDSGKSSPRPGFQRMLELMERGEVGIVAMRDLARVSRSAHDGERFLSIAVLQNVLVDIDGRLYDFAGIEILMREVGLRLAAIPER